MPSPRALLVVACLVCACPVFAAGPDLSLSIRDGRVTLVARNVTVRQILAEWAKVGKTTIVNLDRIPGGSVSIELKDVPESRALQTILRSIAGFMAAPRAVPDAQASRFDRIVVMPVLATAAPAVQSGGGAGSAPQQSFRPQPGGFGPDNPFGRRRPDMAVEEPEEIGDPDEMEVMDEEPVEEEEPAPPAYPVGLRQPGMMPVPSESEVPEPTGSSVPPSGLPSGGTPGTSTVPGVIVVQPGRPGPTQPPKPPGDPR